MGGRTAYRRWDCTTYFAVCAIYWSLVQVQNFFGTTIILEVGLDFVILMKTKSSAFDFDFDGRLWVCQNLSLRWKFIMMMKMHQYIENLSLWCLIINVNVSGYNGNSLLGKTIIDTAQKSHNQNPSLRLQIFCLMKSIIMKICISAMKILHYNLSS